MSSRTSDRWFISREIFSSMRDSHEGCGSDSKSLFAGDACGGAGTRPRWDGRCRRAPRVDGRVTATHARGDIARDPTVDAGAAHMAAARATEWVAKKRGRGCELAWSWS